MTDEEKLAEEFANNGYALGCTKSPFEVAKEGFLAGLKVGRQEKWHKVADGDLPKENKLYLVEIKDNGLAIAYFNGRHWETRYNLGEPGHCVETVIAWCEIPKEI